MAGEIQCRPKPRLTGVTLYAQVWNSTGSVWNGSAFETYATANIANYAITMTEKGTASGFWAGTFPSTSAGTYGVVVYQRAGGSPAETDEQVADGNIDWNGSAVIGYTNVIQWNSTAVKTPTTAGVPEVCLTDAVSHGGTLGSSTATLALSRITATSQTANADCVTFTGNGSGTGFKLVGGNASGSTPAGHGAIFLGGDASTTAGGVAGNGFSCLGGGAAASTNGNGNGVFFAGKNSIAGSDIVGAGMSCKGSGILGNATGHGILATSGGGSVGNGIQATAVSTNGSGMGYTSTGTGSGILTDTIKATGAVTATNASNSINLGTDAITSTVLAASAVTEIWASAGVELSGVPSATASAEARLQFLYQALRNQVTVTGSAQTVSNDAGAVIATASVSDDGTTFTRGEFA